MPIIYTIAKKILKDITIKVDCNKNKDNKTKLKITWA